MFNGSRLLVALLVPCVLAACEGPLGPEGPTGSTGAQGPTGEPGPGTRVVRTGSLDSSGAGFVHLPDAAGTLSDPPAVACYVARSASDNVWVVVASSNATGACGLIGHLSHIDVGIVESSPGWAFRIVAVY